MKINKNKFKEIDKAFVCFKTGRQQEDIIPKGFFTKREYAEKCNLSRSQAERNLLELVKQKKLIVEKFKIRYVMDLRKVQHYKYV